MLHWSRQIPDTDRCSEFTCLVFSTGGTIGRRASSLGHGAHVAPSPRGSLEVRNDSLPGGGEVLGCRRHLLWSQDFSSVSGAPGLSPTHIPIAVIQPPDFGPSLLILGPCVSSLTRYLSRSCSWWLPSHLPTGLGFKCLRDTSPWMPLSPSVIGV